MHSTATKTQEQLTSYRFYGPDHEVDADNESDSTADDIVVFYAFDNAGRTICSYETNHNKTKVTGSSAASYTQNSETSGKNNRLTSAGAMGMTYPRCRPTAALKSRALERPPAQLRS